MTQPALRAPRVPPIRWLLRPPSDTFQTLLLAYAVGTVLVVRLYLRLTGYPQIGTGTLHVAHLLWGGLLMLAAGNVLLMAYGKDARRWAAILLGIGFGLFVDEVGKFVTRDNDYFYRPAAAIIYAAFVALYLAYQAVRRVAPVTERALLLQAVEGLEEAARGDFDQHEKAAALSALEAVVRSGSAYAPLARELEALVRAQDPLPRTQPSRLRRWLRTWGDRLMASPDYRRRLVMAIRVGTALFLCKTLLQVLAVVGVVFGESFRLLPAALTSGRFAAVLAVEPTHATAATLQTGAALVASVFAAYGMWLLPRDLRAGLRQITRAFLILVMVADVFSFYILQFSAAVDALLNLAFLTLVHALRTGSPLYRGEVHSPPALTKSS